MMSASATAQTQTDTGQSTETATETRKPNSWIDQVLGNEAWNKSITDGAIKVLRDAYKTDPAFRIRTFDQARAEHHDGDGKKAIHLFTELANVGEHTPSMLWLARMAYRGEAQDVDKVKAFEWTHKAAKLGDIQAMVQVAYMFLEGQGTAKSESSARHWFLYAADRGSDDANEALLLMFKDGIGGPANKAMALVFAKRQAKNYEIDGLYYMGLAYRDGDGVPQDLEEARRALEAAVEYGHPDAAAALETLGALEVKP